MSPRSDHPLRRVVLLACLLLAGCHGVREVRDITRPEQGRIVYRSPESLPWEPIPDFAPPRTVTNPDNGQPELQLSLDDAIRIALDNSEVVRVLAGFRAVSSGQTIYDPAIANTAIDEARARFDPTLSINNAFNQDETAVGTFRPTPPGATIEGTDTDSYTLDAELSRTNALGGTASARVGVVRSEVEPGILPLDPQARHFTELSYVQPLLQGAGVEANIAPILISSIETERSFFQFKSSVQELVRGTIEAYWALVFARTDRWAREQQVEQAQFAYRREQARKERGFGDLADVAQTRLALANFQANLVAARSDVLQREAALLNILGLSPTEVGEVVPTTPPWQERLEFQWPELVGLAERYRPDIIELKLIIEADIQRLIAAENDARPRLDAVASYRWDGLRGRTPDGPVIATGAGEYTDWTLGINFSVPLGLRQTRAAVRRQDLLVVRDRANLQQGLHSAVHNLALSVRNLDQYYEQYEAFLETREAARDNLLVQQAEFANGRTIFLNVLQAITDWGNAVSSEAQTLSQYNIELASLELETGTILEAHGVRFMEERFQFVGPCCFDEKCYPAGIFPADSQPRYESGDVPAEQSFDLENPLDALENRRPGSTPRLPQPQEPLEPLPAAPRPLQPDDSVRSDATGRAATLVDDGRDDRPRPQSNEMLFPPPGGWRSIDLTSDQAADVTPDVATSLIPERFDRIEPAGTSSGVETEEDSDEGREQDRDRGSGN